MPRFSSRIPCSLEPSRIASAAARHSGPLLDLTQSNPTAASIQYSGLPHVYEPSPLGLESARVAVSAYYDACVDPARIVLTASTSEAYSWLFKLLCEPGDQVLVPRPSYPLFEFLANLEAVDVLQYPMHYHDGWFIDLPALASLITPCTRAIIYVHPNNPTGSYLKPAEYDFLSGFNLPLIVDEVFLDYSFGSPQRSLASRSDVLTFTLSGLSKVAGLPQMKLSWIAVNGPEPLRSDALQSLELIADTFLSVGSQVQQALPSLLDSRHAFQSQVRQRTRANLEFLKGLGAPILEPEAGWYTVLRVPRVRTEEEWVLHLLDEQDVLVQPGFFYDFDTDGYLILSLLTEPATFTEGARRIILATNA